MKNAIDRARPDPKPNPPPYSELFIYYLEGRVSADAFKADEAFIGNWQEDGDTFLFFKCSRDDQVKALAAQHPRLCLIDRYQMTYDEWQGGIPAPFTVGHLHVLPPWHADAGRLKQGSLLLDPGVVFGTGAHPTTHDCLVAMQIAFDRRPVARVLDLGTGTGLLALAAASLGASECVAVDSNWLAAETARRNVEHNDMSKQILVVQGDAKKFMDLPCDLMVSNIHYDIMRHLVTAPGFRDNKQFILSGLLRSQARQIEMQLRRCAAKILHQWAQQGIWYTFHGENP